MGFPIRLNSVFLRTLIAFPLFLAVLSAKVLFNPSQIAESSRGIVMNTRSLRADINLLLDLITGPLSELPWEIVTSPVKLKILIPLKPFIANLANKSISGQKGLWGKRNYFRFRICEMKIKSNQLNSRKKVEKKKIELKRVIGK